MKSVPSNTLLHNVMVLNELCHTSYNKHISLLIDVNVIVQIGLLEFTQ